MNVHESADLLASYHAVAVLGAVRFPLWYAGGPLFAWHYALTAFGASLGVIQITAASSGLRGLWFIANRGAVYALGTLLVLGAFAWFCLAPLWTDGPWKAGTVVPGFPVREWGRAAPGDLPSAYNLSDAHGGLSGPGQGLWFPVGAAAAVALTLGLSSLTNLRMRARPGRESEGIQALGESAYPGALIRSLSFWRRAWRPEVSRQFARGAHPGSLLIPLFHRLRPEPGKTPSAERLEPPTGEPRA